MNDPGLLAISTERLSSGDGSWTAEHGTLTIDTIPNTDKDRILCTSSVGGHARIRFTFSDQTNAFLSGTIEIPIYLEMTDDQVVYGFVYVARSTSLSEGLWSWNILLVPGWNYIRLNIADVVLNPPAVGTWTDFKLLHIATTGQTGRTIKIYVDNIRVGVLSKPKLVWMFDDNWASVYDNAFPAMKKLRIPATMAVIASRVGTAGYTTLDQLKEMQDAGWAIVNHSNTHPQNVLPTANTATQTAEIDGCRNYLIRNGLNYNGSASHYVSPFGEISSSYLATAKSLGMKSFRVVGNSDANNTSRPAIGMDVDYVWPILDVAYGNTFAQIKEVVLAGMRANRTVAILNHRISDGNLSTEWSVSNFNQLLQFLHSIRHLIDFVTVPELHKR